MFEIATISSAISSLQTAAQIARGMMGLRDATLVQGKVIELQSAILAAQTDALTAQSEQYSLVEKIRRLEEEVARVKAWEREKDKYELKEVHPRNFARSIKPNAQGSEPAHLICASCYDNGEKWILQEETYVHVACPKCKTRIQDKPDRSFDLGTGGGSDYV